jgi:hypothetical protein
VLVLPGRDALDRAGSFGERLARLVDDEHATGGLVVLGGGAVPLLRLADAERLVEVAASGEPRALTNNRYSSDVCAVGRARDLLAIPPLPSDNALPRWLEERAGYQVEQLAARDRLALDIDTPLDVAIACHARSAPLAIRRIATAAGLVVPRIDELRALTSDPRAELLVFGRAGARTLAWLERHVRCRVRFLAEERGLRASSPLAIAAPTYLDPERRRERAPRSTLGRLLAARGPDALAATVAELADGAMIDSRVLLADRLGRDESAWPGAEDRFASDLLLADSVTDPWLRALTSSAARSDLPIVMGGHTLVSPGVPILLGRR